MKRRICMGWKPVSGESEHCFYWSDRAAEILSQLPWSAALCLGRWCWNVGSLQQKPIFNLIGIKLALKNTSHIVLSNHNGDTYLLYIVECWHLGQIWARSSLSYCNDTLLCVFMESHL